MLTWYVDRDDVFDEMYGELQILPYRDESGIWDIDENPQIILASGSEEECREELEAIEEYFEKVQVLQ